MNVSRRLVPPVRINEAILLIILIWLVGMYKRGAHSNKKIFRRKAQRKMVYTAELYCG